MACIAYFYNKVGPRVQFGLLLWFFYILANARVPHLLPQPQQIFEKNGGKMFLLERKIVLIDPTDCQLLRDFFEENGCELVGKSKNRVEVRLVEAIPTAFDYRLDGYENEAYRLDVAENLIQIEAVTPTGVIRAAQTLQQLAEGYKSRSAIEAVTITDWPAFKLRGFMHDCGRSFIPIDDLKRHIRLLSRFKINTFHWHLTENQAWRFEVKSYPQLTAAKSMTRHAGQFYTQEECRDLEAYARQFGIVVIPEIDIPGHSAAFRRAMGHDMQTRQGLNVLKTVLAELVEAFPQAPYIHLGADEVKITMPELLPTLMAWVHSLGRKAVVWNPSAADVEKADLVQVWSRTGQMVSGRSNIDCRLNYLNHFDLFSDVAANYLRPIFDAPQGSEEMAGTVACVWNDHVLPSVADIERQNSFYAGVIASASRAWQGGNPSSLLVSPSSKDFIDWEERFLFHKAHSLQNEPIVYVKQSHLRWKIRFKGKTYEASGATVYLNHTWRQHVAGLLPLGQSGDTAFVSTRVYSPEEQKVGALIEFQNYSRSDADTVPDYGRWDFRGSRVWLNDVEIIAPLWRHHGQRVDHETPLADENMAARKPFVLHLDKGWNTVRMVLPYAETPKIRLNKWMFTFVFTDLEGRRALDLDYDPKMD
ncbi:MAG: family 20 glycosylhydrolase [Prevotella sp.]|nr:family 20 glycosylhydrolase [Prevotella sp.]